MAAHPELDIRTCHNYTIAFKFRYQCSNPECLRECVRACVRVSSLLGCG